MLETKDTNPMHFFESTDQYFKIKRKKGVEEYGQWMFNNGYNTALVECRIKVRELETKIQKLEKIMRNDKNMGAMNNCCVPYPAENTKYDDLLDEFPQLLTEEALDIIRKQYYDALSSLCHEEDPFKKIGSAIFAANIYDLIGVIEFKLIDKGIEFYKSKNMENTESLMFDSNLAKKYDKEVKEAIKHIYEKEEIN